MFVNNIGNRFERSARPLTMLSETASESKWREPELDVAHARDSVQGIITASHGKSSRRAEKFERSWAGSAESTDGESGENVGNGFQETTFYGRNTSRQGEPDSARGYYFV